MRFSRLILENFAHDGALYYCIMSCSGQYYTGGPGIIITHPGEARQLATALRQDVGKIRRIAADLQVAEATPAASDRLAAQQLDPQQIQLIRDTAASICDTVKEAKGHKSEVEIQGDVKGKLGGLVGKVVDVGGSGKGSWTDRTLRASRKMPPRLHWRVTGGVASEFSIRCSTS